MMLIGRTCVEQSGRLPKCQSTNLAHAFNAELKTWAKATHAGSANDTTKPLPPPGSALFATPLSESRTGDTSGIALQIVRGLFLKQEPALRQL